MLNDIGRTAVIKNGEIDLVLCHSMVFNGDPQLYRGFGVEPTFYQMVVVKACNSFREAYGLLSDKICPHGYTRRSLRKPEIPPLPENTQNFLSILGTG